MLKSFFQFGNSVLLCRSFKKKNLIPLCKIIKCEEIHGGVTIPSVLASVSEQKTIVDKHNNLRRGVQPTASNMLKMCTVRDRHPASRTTSSSGCGENLYMASYKSSWSNVIQSWADEVKDFQYGYPKPVNEPVFSFCAQVVWYRSNQISCAMAHCPNSNYKYFYVCHNCSP
uniref:SCP domain-containing protein n=1 Tax=Salmo trutta TaxID=8032 RepID=A0A674EPX5_SALTR